MDGDAFAGEGLIEALKPGEKRLVSYAADLGVNVAVSTEPTPRRVQTLRAREGVLIQETEELRHTPRTAVAVVRIPALVRAEQ